MLTNTTLSNNNATGGGGGYGGNTVACFSTGHTFPGGRGGIGQAGALCNTGTASLTNCTIAANKAIGGTGGAGGFDSFDEYNGGQGGTGQAGGILNQGTLTMGNCTVAVNSCIAGVGGPASNNDPARQGTAGSAVIGGFMQTSGSNNLRNDLIAMNTAPSDPDLGGNFTSAGYNLVGIVGDSSGFNNGVNHDLVGTTASPLDPMLDPNGLQDNGGAAKTIGLLAASPAIDAGTSNGAPASDERGVARVGAPDIGAFEFQPAATPTPTPTATATPTPVSQLQNLSTRKQVGTGDDVLIGGFIVVGTDDKKVMLRGLGPSLPVSGALSDPVVELHRADASSLGVNDNWQDTQPAEITATGIPPSNQLESAIVVALPAKAAAQGGAGYTGVLAGKDSGTGIGLLEIYDLDIAANSKLANISTRGFVGSGDDLLIGGFIPGPHDRSALKVLIRALGPSLAAQGVSGVLQDPLLELHDANGTLLVNDNWTDANNAAEIQATLPPPDNRESAIITTLLPTNSGYTAVVRGVNGSTGVALVEVYALN
jgi:hypothetical protein